MSEEKTEQKVFEIPSSNLVPLQQTIEKWQRKGADITFDIIDKYTDKKGITYYRVVVEGGYKLEDWEFAATIEHTDNGNIIRAMPEFQGKIPEKFNDVPPYCEHCKQERNRKDTYIVYNTKTNEFKQVGRNCLEEYTGFDAREAALYASAIKEIYNIAERDPDYEPESNYVSPEQFKAGAYEIVSKSGYDRDKIDGQLTSVLKLNSIDVNERQEARREVYNKHKDKIAEIDKWVQTLANTNNDYLRNAYLAWNKPELEYRDYKLVASLISTYLKSQERAKQAEQTSYVGNVGDKVTFTVQSARVLYSKGSYSYRGPETLVYKIVDTNGNVYKWSTTNDIKEGDVITATIVEHTEYKGEKQTVITRGKIMKDSITDAKKVVKIRTYVYPTKEILEKEVNQKYPLSVALRGMKETLKLHGGVEEMNWKNGDFEVFKVYEDGTEEPVDQSFYDSKVKDELPKKHLKNKLDEIVGILFDGANADVPKNIEKAFESVGGKGYIKEKSPNYLRYEGKVGDYSISGSVSMDHLSGDLHRLAEDLLMGYHVSNGGERGYIPAFIRSLKDSGEWFEELQEDLAEEDKQEEIQKRIDQLLEEIFKDKKLIEELKKKVASASAEEIPNIFKEYETAKIRKIQNEKKLKKLTVGDDDKMEELIKLLQSMKKVSPQEERVEKIMNRGKGKFQSNYNYRQMKLRQMDEINEQIDRLKDEWTRWKEDDYDLETLGERSGIDEEEHEEERLQIVRLMRALSKKKSEIAMGIDGWFEDSKCKDKEKFEYHFEIPVEEDFEEIEYWFDEEIDHKDITEESYNDLQDYRGATETEIEEIIKKELPEKARVYGEWIDENLYTLDIYTDTYFSDEEIMEIAKKVYNIDTDIDKRFYVDDGFVDVYFVTTIKDIVRIKEES